MPAFKATSASCLAKSYMMRGTAGFFNVDSISIERRTAPGAHTLQCPSPTMAASPFSPISAHKALSTRVIPPELLRITMLVLG